MNGSSQHQGSKWSLGWLRVSLDAFWDQSDPSRLHAKRALDFLLPPSLCLKNMPSPINDPAQLLGEPMAKASVQKAGGGANSNNKESGRVWDPRAITMTTAGFRAQARSSKSSAPNNHGPCPT